jgi:hypothetical protein
VFSPQEHYTLTCVFWKEEAESSVGTWSPEGCHTEQPSPSQVLCHCKHLTYFAVLMVCVSEWGSQSCRKLQGCGRGARQKLVRGTEIQL